MIYKLKIILLITLFIGCDFKNEVHQVESSANELIESDKTDLDINVKEMMKMVEANNSAVIIDIRREDELSSTYPQFENAIAISDSLIYLQPALLNKWETIILMCHSGVRSSKLKDFLFAKGIKVYNLKGGIKAYYNQVTKPEKKIIPKSFESEEDPDEGC